MYAQRSLKLHGHDQPCYPANSIASKDIRKAVMDEMCMTVEDYLSRRTRHLLLDAKSAMEAAPLVAKIMAGKMNKDDSWINQQIIDFTKLAKNYSSPNLKHQTFPKGSLRD